MSTHYHVGYNLAGETPAGDTVTYPTLEEAILASRANAHDIAAGFDQPTTYTVDTDPDSPTGTSAWVTIDPGQPGEFAYHVWVSHECVCNGNHHPETYDDVFDPNHPDTYPFRVTLTGASGEYIEHVAASDDREAWARVHAMYPFDPIVSVELATTRVYPHYHPRLDGSIERCDFDDFDYDQQVEEIHAWLNAHDVDTRGGLTSEARTMAILDIVPNPPMATAPTCLYWQAGPCGERRYQTEPLPLGQFGPATLCETHLTWQWRDMANLGDAWGTYPFGEDPLQDAACGSCAHPHDAHAFYPNGGPAPMCAHPECECEGYRA